MGSAKQEALKLIGTLPEEATWDEILYRIYVKKKVDAGIKAAVEGRVVSHEDVRAQLVDVGKSR